jgi:hypothetical protein
MATRIIGANPEGRYLSKVRSAANERRQNANAERMCLHGKWLTGWECGSKIVFDSKILLNSILRGDNYGNQ